MVKKDFPKIHFYDQDLVSLYDETWLLIKDFWKKGTSQNGLHSRYFAHPDSTRINQFDTCFSSFFLVYSNRIYPVMSGLDNFYAKQEESGAIRGEYRESDGKPVHSKDNPKGVLPPLFAWAEFNIYHKLGLKKRIREVLPVLEKYYRWIEQNFKAENGLYSVPLAATMMENSPRDGMAYPIDFNSQMALAAFYVSELADIVNDKETNYTYKKAYFSLKTKINSLMWDEREGFYYDLDESQKRLKVKTIASFWPLIAEIPNEARGERLIEHLVDPHEFGIENPFPTLAVKDKRFDPQGAGYRGGVYPPLNYMVIKGLEKYKRHDLAREFAIRHLYHVLDGLYTSNGKEGLSLRGLCAAHRRAGKVAGEEGFPPDNVPSLHRSHHGLPDAGEHHRPRHLPAAQDRGLDDPHPRGHGHRGPCPEAQSHLDPQRQEQQGLGSAPGKRKAVLPDDRPVRRAQQDAPHPFRQVLAPRGQAVGRP